MAWNIAHRGASHLARENTLEAFQKAYALGAHGVELDVRFDQNQNLVLFHDTKLNRLADGLKKQSVLETPTEILKKHGVTMLEQVLEWAPPDFFLLIELKHEPTGHDNLVDYVIRLVQEKERLLPTTFIISFHEPYIHEVKEKCSDMQVGLTFDRDQRNVLKRDFKRILALDTEMLLFHVSLINETLIRAIHSQKKVTSVWGISEDPKQVKTAITCGIDYLITDIPEEVKRLLNETGSMS